MPTGTLSLYEPARFLVYYQADPKSSTTPTATVRLTHDGQTIYRYQGTMQAGTSPNGAHFFIYTIQRFYAAFLVHSAQIEKANAQYVVNLGRSPVPVNLSFNAAPLPPPSASVRTPTPRPTRCIGCLPLPSPTATQVVAPSVVIESFCVFGRSCNKKVINVTVVQLRRITFVVRYHIMNQESLDTPESVGKIVFYEKSGKRSGGHIFPFQADGIWQNRPASMDPPAYGYFDSDITFISKKKRTLRAICTVYDGNAEPATMQLQVIVKPKFS